MFPLKPCAGPPLSVVKTYVIESAKPFFFAAAVMLPMPSSSCASPS